MKILHIATHEGSGAGRAALRLHLGLLSEQVDSWMLVSQKGSAYESVVKLDRQTTLIKKAQAKLLGSQLSRTLGNGATFSINASPSFIRSQIKTFQANVLNLHWIGWEFLRIEEFKSLNTPLVWTLQDMWSFTGGCHYSEECDRYTQACGACPQLRGNRESDLSRWVWQRKAKAWKNLNLTIVAPSTWMAECARASSLFRDARIEVIPFCLDTEKYQPIDKLLARKALNLPLEKQIVLFGALSATQDKRKGFHLLLPALQKLSEAGWRDRIELVVFGASQPEDPIDMGFKAHYLGNLHNDESLAQAYSAADVMIVPSIQESFGQTASESLSCGTPVVAFNATGLKDIVDHQQSGYLVRPYEIEDLAQGIAWTLEDQERHRQLCHQAREKAERAFALKLQAQRYVTLYNEILDVKQRQLAQI